MPTYEYQCDRGHTFERVQKMSDRPLTKCPVCGAKSSRIISGGQGVIFKGSGFYITDYGKDGKGPRKEPAAAPSDGAATAGGADGAKPAASSPTTESSGSTATESKSPARKSSGGKKPDRS